jgi:ABC-2 type transport system ATP-binding protein
VTSREPVLSARGVSRRFGAETALQPTDLDVCAGELLALVGPNGAGKSTLLAILAGALEPTTGQVQRRAPRVGWAPQRPALYGRLTPRENLELFAELEGERDPPAAAERLLVEFELPGDGRRSAELSVGNRQRLNLALAFLGAPDVLLLDEPTASLDPRHRRLLWERAASLRGQGAALVLVTQSVEELERVADRVAVLSEGRLVFLGDVEEYERSSEAARALA